MRQGPPPSEAISRLRRGRRKTPGVQSVRISPSRVTQGMSPVLPPLRLWSMLPPRAGRCRCSVREMFTEASVAMPDRTKVNALRRWFMSSGGPAQRKDDVSRWRQSRTHGALHRPLTVRAGKAWRGNEALATMRAILAKSHATRRRVLARAGKWSLVSDFSSPKGRPMDRPVITALAFEPRPRRRLVRPRRTHLPRRRRPAPQDPRPPRAIPLPHRLHLPAKPIAPRSSRNTRRVVRPSENSHPRGSPVVSTPSKCPRPTP